MSHFTSFWSTQACTTPIAKVLSTPTPAQIKKHAECYIKQNLKINSAAVKRYQDSLSPDRKAQVLVNDSAAHKKQRQSLSPENKTQMLCNDADAHRMKKYARRYLYLTF
jgi:hypothetical protein